MKLSFFIFLLLAGSLSAQITDIGRLPAQNPEQIYEESSPVIISEDEFLIFFISSNNIINGNINDTLYSSRSTDGGKTWKDNSFIAELRETRSYGASYLTTLKTKTGRIVIAFTDWIRKKMAVTYSDDNGYNWSEFTYLAGSGNIVPYIRTSVNNLMLSELNDGKLILSFCSDVKKTAYYRESLDEGQTWSDSAYLFYSGTDIIKYISFVSLNGDSIAAFFELQGNLNNGIYKRISSDGGESWSTQTKLFDTGKVETRPRVIKISKDNMWMIFEVSDTLSHVSPFNDIYFTRSTYGVENWDTPQRFTSYAGKDDFVNASVINNKPFITFSSTRFTNIPQISYAVPGETVEMFKPPFIVNSEVFSDSVKQKTFVFNAKIIDDQSVDNAFLVPETDNPIILYDDGKHNDSDSSDNIFGNVVDLEHIPPSEMALIDVNKITLPINNKGIISGSYLTPSFSINTKISASDNEQQQISFDTILTIQYNSFNQFEEYNFLFSGGFLLSGYSNETLWSNGVASSMLLEDYLPGKVGSNRSDPLNKVYVVKKEDSPFGYSWRQWKNAVTLGAEFYDGDGDGIYNPVDKNWNGTWDKNEDMPMLLGDETAWCVYNDGLPGEMRRWGVNPQGIEVKQTVFATNKPGLENVMFIRYSILNTGMVADEMDSVYFGIWDDPDLGDWNDDLVGCDTLLNSGFVYNDSTDYYYGTTPPSFFTVMLQGPAVSTGNSLDTSYFNAGVLFGQQMMPGWNNLDLAAHIFLMSGNPLLNDPDNDITARYYLEGKTSFGSYPDPCTFSYTIIRGGVNCNDINPALWMSGDPVADYGWIDNSPLDKRNMISAGPFELDKNKPQKIIAAYVLGRGTDPINSISVARENVRKAIQEYKSNFASMTYSAPPPTKPVVSYRLYHNYPNPFNPVTTIRYELPEDGIVSIEIFDILGQKVKTLLNKFQKANRYEVKFDGSSLASGIYIYWMKVNDFITSKKMVLIK